MGHMKIQNLPDVAHLVRVRRMGFFPRRCGVVEGKLVPAELAGGVEDGHYMLHGGDGREADLLAGGWIKELEVGAGVGRDEPAVRRAPDVAVRDGWAR